MAKYILQKEAVEYAENDGAFEVALWLEDMETVELSDNTTDIQPVKRGEWIRKEGYDPRDNFYYCSECNRIINVISGDSLSNYPYCHCGTDMRGDGNE